jgi:hypothetical protein
LSAEDSFIRRLAIWDATTDALAIGGYPGPNTIVDSNAVSASVANGDSAANGIPDIVGALRVDQAWGSAQVAAALHQNRAGNYGNDTTGAGGGCVASLCSPADAYGWAAMGGIVLNLPWAKGDKVFVEGTVAQGAGAYVGLDGNLQGNVSVFQRFNGRNVQAAWAMDSVFGNLAAAGGQTGQQLTNYWTVSGGLEHYWTPALRTDIFGSYTGVSYNSTATTLFCQGGQSPVKNLAGGALTSNAGCSPDFNLINIGVRTIWNPAAQFDIGLEVMYDRVETKYDAGLVALNFAGSGGRAPGLYAPSSENVFSGILRFQRNFWP